MSAPALWIGVPLIAAAVLSLSRNRQAIATRGGIITGLLALLALVVPIDTALGIGPFSLKLGTSVELLGRSFSFGPADGPLLAFIYGSATFWFLGTAAIPTGTRAVPLGLAIIALLLASAAVEPFLFAAPLIEMAALMSVPLFIQSGDRPGRGVLRFLTYQTLGMPFILIAGWMLAGVEASPSDLALTSQAGTMLGLGFALLLGVFPLYNWISMLAEETSSFVLGFMLWLLPVFTIVFALGFLDRYAWLRTTPQLSQSLALAGGLMVATCGWFAAFEKHLGRMMALVAVAETGLAILAMSTAASRSLELVFLFLIPRGIELALWSLSLAIISERAPSLHFDDVRGLGRLVPAAAAGALLAHFSMVGLPLLAGFPARLALWRSLSGAPGPIEAVLLIGVLGIVIGAIRSLSVLAVGKAGEGWASAETLVQKSMIGAAAALLAVLGVFPQVMQPFLERLPQLFEHLAL